MKKILLVLAMAVAGFQVSADAKNLTDKNYALEFAAPVVGSKTDITNIPAGQIVYEQGSGFWGLTTNGGPSNVNNWVQIASTTSQSVQSENSERLERTTISSGTACTGGNCTITSTSGTWLQSVTWNATGDYTLNIAPGTFSAPPSCSCIHFNGFCNVQAVTTATAFRTVTFDTSGSPTNARDIQIMCMGPR